MGKGNICGIEDRCGIRLETAVSQILQSQIGRVTVAEVGPAFGHCIIPLLLLASRVTGVAVEVSRKFRQLLAKSVADNNLTDRMKIVPAFVETRPLDRLHMDIAHLANGS